MQKLISRLAVGALVTVLGVATAPQAVAQSDREVTSFTVDNPVEVGPNTLPAGTYLIKVVQIDSNRNVLQVTDLKEQKLFAKVLTRPHPILADEVVPVSRIVYYATSTGEPKAIRTWWADNTGNGHDIIYPKRRAMELAAMGREPVPSYPDTVKESEYKSVLFTDIPPAEPIVQREEPPAFVPVKPVEEAPTVIADNRLPERLPRTGSDVPLSAALGLLSIAGAFGLRAFTNRN